MASSYVASSNNLTVKFSGSQNRAPVFSDRMGVFTSAAFVNSGNDVSIQPLAGLQRRIFTQGRRGDVGGGDTLSLTAELAACLRR